MDRLKISLFFCIAVIAAIFLAPPEYYHQIRGYYYRFVGGRLMTPDKHVPTRPVPVVAPHVAAKPVKKNEQNYTISGLDPTVGPQITVFGEPKSASPASSSPEAEANAVENPE